MSYTKTEFFPARSFYHFIDFFSKPEQKWTKISYQTAPHRSPPLPSTATSRSFVPCCPARSRSMPGSTRRAPGPAGPPWWWRPRSGASRRSSASSNEELIPTVRTGRWIFFERPENGTAKICCLHVSFGSSFVSVSYGASINKFKLVINRHLSQFNEPWQTAVEDVLQDCSHQYWMVSI